VIRTIVESPVESPNLASYTFQQNAESIRTPFRDRDKVSGGDRDAPYFHPETLSPVTYMHDGAVGQCIDGALFGADGHVKAPDENRFR